MASTNGILSPPPNSDSVNSSMNLSAKRKRDDGIEGQTITNGTTDSGDATSRSLSPEESKTLAHLLIDVLKGHDTAPSILTRSIPDLPRSTGPQLKRQRGEDNSVSQTTILAQISSNAYASVDEVLEDIDTAVTDVLDKFGIHNGVARNQFVPVPRHQTEVSTKVEAFKQRAHQLVKREKANIENRLRVLNESTEGITRATNGISGSKNSNQTNAPSGEKTVLTLYGSAPQPKQLFSSFQLPTSVSGDTQKILQTIREAGLPTGITTTKIVPVPSAAVIEDKKRVPTLGEVFPIPPTVPVMAAPKPSKVANTRSLTVGWYPTNSTDSQPRTASYSKQTISSGQWLDYSNTTAASQSNKRKQRLSLVGGKAPSLEAEAVQSDAEKLDILFKSAYSSFAPTRDDTAALVPTGLMDRLWWQQIGEKSFERMVEKTNSLEFSPASETDPTENADELLELDSDLGNLVQDVIDPSLVPDAHVEKSEEEKDVEEVLTGISELLDTLNSYQRVRQMSLNASSRSAGLLSAPDTSSHWAPTKITEDEQITYETLKSALAVMIASLPPFAVAKLGPDRLSELSISTKIEVQTTNHKGVMPEDQVTARANLTALGAAAATSNAIPPVSLHRSASSTALYGTQYQTAPRSAAPAHQNYYGSSQTPVRPPSSNLQRPPQTAPNLYQPQRPAPAGGYSGNGYGTPTYPHQASRPVQPTYAPSNQQYAQTTPSQAFLRAPQNGFQQSPRPAQSVPMNGRYTNGQPSYANQTQATTHNGMNYQYTGSQGPRQASPQTSSLYSSQQPVSGARPVPYSTPTPTYPQNPMGQPANGGLSRPLQTPQVSTSGYTSSFLSHSQQNDLLERQRAQLSQSQQAAQPQALALSAMQARAAMASPSKPQQNSPNPVAAGFQ